MQGFRDHGPKVPVVLSGPHVGLRVPFDGVVEVGEQKRVPYKEHRSVVPDEVPVPVLGVEFDGETPDVALGIGGPSLPGHGGESDEYLGLLPDLREQFRLGIAGYVVGDGELSECPGTLGMHTSLGDHFAIEMTQFFQEPYVL